jgi:hypothetical protein
MPAVNKKPTTESRLLGRFDGMKGFPKYKSWKQGLRYFQYAIGYREGSRWRVHLEAGRKETAGGK